MRLTKEEFCAYVEDYKNMIERSNNISNALGIYDVWEGDEWLDNYYNFLSDMCELPANDNYETLLDWWCFETEFGKYDNEIKHQNGSVFEINNVEDLYIYIMSYEVKR